ncbi:MAG: hypothetical protein HYX68_13355 [Planctomycetes bacterium]|nr:hypothetical protein [Planctomycetota bacterium]
MPSGDVALLEPLPTYSVRLHRLDPTLAELRIAFADLPADVQVSGRLMGPRCKGMSTVEIAYPLRPHSFPEWSVLIPEPMLWEEDAPYIYGGPVEFRRDGKPVGKILVSCGIKVGS